MKSLLYHAFVLAGFSTLLGACTTVTPPPGYAQMKNSAPYCVKAVSSDANVFTLRHYENDDEDNGTLSYWSDSMRKHLTLSRGYTLTDSGTFTTAEGPGTWMVMNKKHKGVDHLYVVGVVVDDDDIYVLEAGGEKQSLEEDLDDIKRAFQTLE